MAFSPQLLAFLADRSAFCYAMQDILLNVGQLPQARLPGNQAAMPDEICAVDFRRQRSAQGEPRDLRPNLGDGTRQEYSMFSGVAEIRYGMLRTDNIESTVVGCMTKMDEKEAIVRACMLRSAHYFTVGRLANFTIDDIREDIPPTYGVDNTNDRLRDVFVLSFTIDYERVMANFPAG